MTPAEMREMAAKACDVSARSTTVSVIPTAADEALEKARAALDYTVKGLRFVDDMLECIIVKKCREALAALDAAKAKGGE